MDRTNHSSSCTYLDIFSVLSQNEANKKPTVSWTFFLQFILMVQLLITDAIKQFVQAIGWRNNQEVNFFKPVQVFLSEAHVEQFYAVAISVTYTQSVVCSLVDGLVNVGYCRGLSLIRCLMKRQCNMNHTEAATASVNTLHPSSKSRLTCLKSTM